MVSNSASTPLRIVLVEDDEHDVLAFRRAFQKSQVASEITHYVRAEKALERLVADASSFDLVVADHKLPGMSGLELCKALLDREVPLPLVLLTGTGTEHLAVEALKVGVDDYLIKDPNRGYLDLLLVVLPDVVRRHGERLARQQAEEALRESEKRYRRITEAVTDYIFTVRVEDGRAVETTHGPTSVAVTGYSPEDFAADPDLWIRMVHEQDREAVLEQAARVLSGQDVPPLEHRIVRKDSVTRWVRNTSVPHRSAEGKLLSYDGLIRDITERKRVEEAREKLIEELDAFAHTVAHDLKSPLSVIFGFTEMLEEDYTTMPDEEIRDYLQTIVRVGHKASSIIDELLLLAGVRKMEEVEKRPLDMASIVAEAQQRLAHMIEEHQAEIILPDTWPVALGHGPWVEEVWVNYLNNAIKYGGQPPHVELGATKQPDGMVRFWVRDNGPGLRPEEQARLFTPFTRLDQVRTKGHGLGLSIVGRIVEKLGGQVGVESEVGRGSVFTFTLPATEI
jgi:PAS domain S-box-containing protein